MTTLAFNNDFLFSAAYAFRMDLGQGSLGIGANVGLANQALERLPGTVQM
jgi:hypothetical protein